MQRKCPLGQKPFPVIKKRSLVVQHERFIQLKSKRFEEDYTVARKLGEGSFGSVYEVLHRTLGLRRALKVIRNTKTSTYPSKEQIDILIKLDHPNVLKLYEFYEVKDRFFLVTEYFDGRELFTEIIQQNPFTQEKATDITVEILKALHYTHVKGVAHRDIKAENILVKKQQGRWVVKIIDWGLGTIVGGGELVRKCGTPEYVAPEVFSGKYNEKCDMWSLGVILYIMLLGEMPFKGKTPMQTVKLVTEGNFPRSRNWHKISADAQDLICKLLSKNPKQRLSAEDTFKHQWIEKHMKKTDSPKDLGQTLKRIKNFHVRNNLGLAAFNFINNFLASEKDRRKLSLIFDYLDENRDGVLNREELLKGYAQIYGVALANKVIDEVFEKLDTNGSGKLQYNEFLAYAVNEQKHTQELKFKQAFGMFDTDKDGRISCSQTKSVIIYLIQLLCSNIEELDSQEIQDIIDQFDANKDGYIDEQEFLECLKNISKLYDQQALLRRNSLSMDFTQMKQCEEKQQELEPKLDILQTPERNGQQHYFVTKVPPPVYKEPTVTQIHSEPQMPPAISGEPRRKGRPKNSERKPITIEPTTRQTRRSKEKPPIS